MTTSTELHTRLPIAPEPSSAGVHAGLLLALALAPAVATADVGAAKSIASGLANPRGIAFAPNGALHVAESGKGGAGVCTPSPPNPAVSRCYGETGALTRIIPGVGVQRIVTGLPSLVLANGSAEGGPVDVAFLGTAAFVTMSWGGDPAIRPTLGGRAWLFGQMLQVSPSGKIKVVADVAAHETRYNPYGGAIDSNPYNTQALPGRRIVADAGANALVEVFSSGRTRTLAVLPPLPPAGTLPFPREPVPTSVVEGPDGALYVGQLSSFPFWPESSSVLRVASDGSSIQTYARGFTAIVDLAFDNGGALYVLEVARGQVGPFPPPPAPNPGLGIGRLKRICPGEGPTVLLEGLTYPGGVAIGPDDAAYLTNFGTSADAGEVLRLEVEPCP
jgi:DNA-binding beta-propeller fold protein YncE